MVSGLYALGALLPFWFLTSPEAGAAFFPAAGLTVSVLLLSPRRTWLRWLLVIGFTELVVDLTHDQTMTKAIGFALANTLEPLVGATLVRWSSQRWHATLRERLIGFLTSAAVIGPVVGAAIGATTAVAFGQPAVWWSVFGNWWLGDALGVLVVATAILAWSRRSPYEPVISLTETVAYAVLATALAIVPALLWHHPMLYAVLPVLIWAALRGGSRAVSLAGVGVAFAADWAAVSGRVDQLVAPATAGQHLVFVQLVLGVTLVAALVLAVEVADRRRVEAQVRRAEGDRIESERLAIEVAAAERRHITRETHDVVGHALNVMLLQAGAARRMLDADDGSARASLESIESVGRAAFRDLDAVLALTAPAPETVSNRDIANITMLVETMRRAGMDVSMTIDGDRGELPNIVEWSAYRIVQEALTNVAKHAPRAGVRVAIRFEPTLVEVSVEDDGDPRGESKAGRQGRGLIGMAERVAALGGELEAGRRGMGFAVVARLPLREARH